MRKEFERTSPEAVGIRSEDILDYIENLECSSTEMHGIMIMRHGKICAEGWWSPFAPNLRHGLQSHTKTYAATAVGIAYTEGILTLEERLIDIFPDESPKNPSENLKLLTVRDVLCMGCGMDIMPLGTKEWIREFMNTPVNHKPGTAFMYNSTGSSILGAIVRQKTGEGLQEYLSKRLFCKIGINPDNIRWYCMPDGMEMGGGGMLATTEDNLRLMKLYADGGIWEGERILAQDYVKLATTKQNNSDTEAEGNPEATDNFLGYGFQIWMCKPKGVYRADGAMGQFTIVSPDQDMLIAITETAGGAHWAQSTLNITWDFMEKVKNDFLPENKESAKCLKRKLNCLNLPNPVYQPYSSRIDKINGKRYSVESGALSVKVANFMFRDEAKKIQTFSFAFDNYGCVWSTQTKDDSECVRISTYGGRFTNLIENEKSQTQILVCDGAWVSDDIFSVTLRSAETCLTKKLTFNFTDEGVTIEDMDNSAFRKSDKANMITAKEIKE